MGGPLPLSGRYSPYDCHKYSRQMGAHLSQGALACLSRCIEDAFSLKYRLFPRGGILSLELYIGWEWGERSYLSLQEGFLSIPTLHVILSHLSHHSMFLSLTA